MVKVEFKQYGKSLTEIALALDKFWFDYQAEIIETGEKINEDLKEFIDNHIKRPSSKGNLKNAITHESIIEPGVTGFAIGDIKVLDEKAKYWRAVNWGSSHMVGKHLPRGFFKPGKEAPDSTEFRKGRWYSGSGKKAKYSPIVTKPIPPMYFVEHLLSYARRAIEKLNAKFLKEAGK